MKRLLASAMCLALAACASEPAPNARPLTAASIKAIGPTHASVTGNEEGVAKAFYHTSVNGAGKGIGGVIGAMIAEGIINVGPDARAGKQADEVAKVEPVEAINASLVAAVKDESAKAPLGGVTFDNTALTYKSIKNEPMDGTVEITTSYTLSEDSSVMRAVAVATYSNPAMPYKTPYTFKSAAPESESKGPLYRNTFTYFSTPLPVPTLTPELRERMVANIKESYKDAAGVMPAEGTSENRSMQHEIELANDDQLSPNEVSLFLTREWLSGNGAKIKEEIRRAHDFIAHYVLLDINRTAVPSLTGEDELVDTTSNERTVRRIGKGVEAGSYVSSANNVTQFATFGNTAEYSKTTAAYINSLKEKSAAKPVKGKS